MLSQGVQTVQATSVVRLCVLRYANIPTYIPRYLHIPIPLTVVNPVSLPKKGHLGRIDYICLLAGAFNDLR